ncbi:unnamed protein product [Somion occarium]|uniref:Phosphatidylinositol 4-kinase n=1 Tax=Somion occarium TaxID=3059160 RepID=A0ABP1D974_9APHY
MSHALLLRLFLSPSFFTVHVALQYLRTYADNIGITYYLTRRLRGLQVEELREVWGFICHLLVTRPSKSRALECFVVETSQKSTHVAMLTLWYMQAALKDIALARHDTEPFLICQRVLNQCHEIIFGDLAVSTAPYGVLNQLVLPGMIRAPAMPMLTNIMGEVAVEQGRIDYPDDNRLPDFVNDPTGSPYRESMPREPDDDADDLAPPHQTDEEAPTSSPNDYDFDVNYSIPSKGPLSRRKTIAAQTSPALPLRLKLPRKPRLSEDPFGQYDPPSPVAGTTPFQSTPSLSSARHPTKTSSVHALEVLQRYDTRSQIHLLRSHYCRSVVEFLLTLENICNKLLVVPKLARVSALRAELTGLNHMLPAEICMPMWCSSSDTTRASGIPEPHHRIVRIPPGESVVLNSAERAPYLLLIEILHDDLDFDPSKRSNRDILKKIVQKETERKGASRDLIPFNRERSLVTKTTSRTMSESVHPLARDAGVFGDDVAPNEPDGDEIPLPQSPTSSMVSPDNEEEIDLVEQLYGADEDIRLRSADLSESIVLPPAPKNRELDMAAWSRSSSLAQSTVQGDSSDSYGRSLSQGGYGPQLNGSHTQQPTSSNVEGPSSTRVLSLDEYSERMRTAAVMLAQLNANLTRESITLPPPGTPTIPPDSASPFRWLPNSSWISGSNEPSRDQPQAGPSSSAPMRMRLAYAEAAAIRSRIMDEMLALEEERMERMRENRQGEGTLRIGDVGGSMKTAEDEGIIRRELSKADPSAVVFSESWAAKKSRIRQASPYGHLANWDCVSVIVKTGGDLRQEQLAVQLIQQFEKIWKEENCACWVRYFRILITGNSSGLVETITDAVSIHSIKKAEYARRLAAGRLGHVTLYDHFKTTYGDPSSAKFARAQRNFAKSLAGYSLVTYFLQIKDRHNGNILLDRDGHLIHIDFGFMLSNSPGGVAFEAAPFKLPLEYIEVLGGIDGVPFREFRRLFKEGFEAARKHCDRIVTLVELMQKDSTLPCFTALGEQTATQLRERFQQGLTQSAVEEHVQRLIDTSLGSNWTRLYDSYQYYSQSIF